MRSRVVGAALIAAVAITPASADAQTLASKVAELIRFGSCAQALCLVTAGTPGVGDLHKTHFLLAAQVASTDLTAFLTSSITASVGRLPVSATSSGTSFSFVNGAPVQSTSSSGPIFAERAATLGEKRFLLGGNTSAISYSKLRGQSIKDLTLNLSHQDVNTNGLGDLANENDIVAINLNMKLNLQVTSLFATYGVTDRLDVSVAVPFVMSSLNATGFASVFNPSAAVTGNHKFGTDPSTATLTATSAVKESKAGVGDISARAKYNFLRSKSSGLSVLADVHLPTGDAQNFSGAGSTSANAVFIASTTYGDFSPHANVGFALRTGSGQNNAVVGTLGFDHMLNKQATVAVDILSEFQAGGDAGKLPGDINLSLSSPPRIVPGSNVPSQKDNPMALSAGGRFLVSGFTLMANGLVPLKSGGLQASFIWTLGLERSF